MESDELYIKKSLLRFLPDISKACLGESLKNCLQMWLPYLSWHRGDATVPPLLQLPVCV